jgi:hypothetical protein
MIEIPFPATTLTRLYAILLKLRPLSQRLNAFQHDGEESQKATLSADRQTALQRGK